MEGAEINMNSLLLRLIKKRPWNGKGKFGKGKLMFVYNFCRGPAHKREKKNGNERKESKLVGNKKEES